ncbi:hypothetical protein BDQ17DRAFT_1427611 [Cyathus striatus]|nr:hypothetical protein BDQ17DRAFT_1427611 [Cyathus striatus]
MSFHLRPVSDTSPSPSPTASGTPPGDRSPPFKVPSSSTMSSSPSTSTKRRPLSPSSLRDVDLSHTPDMPPRKYPAPPTGHDLMAMFPPAPPDNSPETRGGPTSGFFQRQERAFFAQAGKEIVRVRVEVDLPHTAEPDHPKSRGREPSSSRTWAGATHPQPVAGSSLPHHSPVQSSTSIPQPYSNSRPPHRGPIPVTPAPIFPVGSHPPPPSQMAPNLHSPATAGLQTPPQDPSQPGAPVPKPEFQNEDYDADEAWRRPMPYNERRRAGKHTRRVIVRT